jgi:hypothetical protein
MPGNTRFPGSVDWTQSSVDWYWNHEFSGSRFSRLNSEVSRLNLLLKQYQPSPMRGKTKFRPNVIERATETKDLCQATTQPCMALRNTPKTCPTIHSRIFIKMDNKTQKSKNSQNPFKSKAKWTWIDVMNNYLTTIKDIDIDVSSKTHL